MFEDRARVVKEKMPLQKNCRTKTKLTAKLGKKQLICQTNVLSSHFYFMKYFILIATLSTLNTYALELPAIDFKEAFKMDNDTKLFTLRLIRYTCDGALSYSRSKQFIPRIYDYSVISGKNIEHSFRLAFDRADNHAEIIITKNQTGDLKAYIPKDTRDGLCILGKFYLRDIEAYERNFKE